MKRKLAGALALLSLLLCVGAAASWLRSYWRTDHVYWSNGSREVSLAADGGIILLAYGPIYRGPNAVPFPPGKWRRSYGRTMPVLRRQIATARYRLGALGIAYKPNQLDLHPSGASFYSSHRLYLPHWLAIAIFAIGPAVFAWGWWRRVKLKRSRGHCPACGYNLRGSLGRACPECGAVRADMTV